MPCYLCITWEEWEGLFTDFCVHLHVCKNELVDAYFILSLTFCSSLSLCGLQCSWHQGSTCPLKCILSTTMFKVARWLAVVVSSHRLGLHAYRFKWHASSVKVPSIPTSAACCDATDKYGILFLYLYNRRLLHQTASSKHSYLQLIYNCQLLHRTASS